MDNRLLPYFEQYPNHQSALQALAEALRFDATVADQLADKPLLDREAAHRKWRRGEPLFAHDPEQVPYDLFSATLVELAATLPADTADFQAVERLLAGFSANRVDLEMLGAAVHTGDDAYVATLATGLGVTSTDLWALLQRIFGALYHKRAKPYWPWIGDSGWRRGICPCCGSGPRMGRLTEEDGRRKLTCRLCQTEWQFDRLRCPFCDDDMRGTEEPRMRYFTAGADRAHRVECCDRCGRYLKTVDERLLSYPAYVPAEEIVTVHSDEEARAAGYG